MRLKERLKRNVLEKIKNVLVVSNTLLSKIASFTRHLSLQGTWQILRGQRNI
jgi:hypothetical protein